MADKQYTNLDREGLIFLLTLLNATLQNEFSGVKNDIDSIKPQDTVTETGEKPVKSSGIHTYVGEATAWVKDTIEGNAVNTINAEETYDSKKYPTVEATKKYVGEATSWLRGVIEGNAISNISDSQTYESTQYPTVEATKSYVTNALSLLSTVSIEVLEALPPLEEARQNVFYFIPASTTGETNYYDEYVYVPESGAVPAHFELIGSTAVDLSGYVKAEQLHALTNSEITEIYNSVFTA